MVKKAKPNGKVNTDNVILFNLFYRLRRIECRLTSYSDSGIMLPLQSIIYSNFKYNTFIVLISPVYVRHSDFIKMIMIYLFNKFAQLLNRNCIFSSISGINQYLN